MHLFRSPWLRSSQTPSRPQSFAGSRGFAGRLARLVATHAEVEPVALQPAPDVTLAIALPRALPHAQPIAA